MRFDALHLPAFGPFTDLRLEFPAAEADLHLIYGANEAGKSSLLRAIGDLLFEIPLRSTDNFLHDNKILRIAADLRSRDGRTLSIQRRKGSKNTLLAADGTPLPDDALNTWLGHLDRAYFTTMFGLSSAELRTGAEELLRGEGDLGKALFSASLGGTPVHKILQSLEDGAKMLFAGRARSSIRAGTASYTDELKLSKEKSVKAEEWEEIEHALAEAAERSKTLNERRVELQQRSDWLQRCLDALPTLGKLHAKEQAIAELPKLPSVAASFVAEARAALSDQVRMQAELHRCREEVARLQVLIEACQPREDLLAREADIEARHEGFSVFRDQSTRLAQRQRELAKLELELQSGMKDLGITGELASLENLRLTAAETSRLKELAAACLAGRQQIEAHARALREKEAAIHHLESRLAKFTALDVTRVREALAQTGAAEEALRTLDVARTELAKAERDLRAQQRLLNGAPEDPAAIHALRLPARAATNALQAECEAQRQAKKAAEETSREAAKKTQRLQRELAQLERQGALPSLADLSLAREQREQAWRKIASLWIAGDNDDSRSLVTLHEELQKRTDNVADQLRAHADKAAKAEQLRFSIAEAEEDAAALDQALSVLEAAAKEWQARWEALWKPAGVPALSPEEMAEWREHWQEFCRRYEHWQSLSIAFAGREATVAAAEQRLREALNDAGSALAVLLDKARRQVMEADKAHGARITLEEQLERGRQEREQLLTEGKTLERHATAASEEWLRKAVDLRLEPGISPDAGMELVTRRRELLQRFDAWKAVQTEVEQLTRQTEAFVLKQRDLASGLAFEPAAPEVLDGVLWRALNEAREARSTRRKHAEELNLQQAREHRWLTDGESATARLTALIAEAGLSEASELEPLLVSLESLFKLTDERTQLLDSLHGPARGEPLESFIARVRGENPETLGTERLSVEAEVAALETQRQEALHVMVEAGQRQAALKQAGGEAALHRQLAEGHAASLRTDAAQYLRLRLATHFLEQQIDRFRQENQAPLMKRAGALFQAMTLNRFEGLAIDYGDDDKPLIVGHREGGNVPVTGMSEGTRDQLYLALRLAAIELHIDARGPLPLVLDDLLITFDDTRAAALLPVLRDLSKKTQVLLFTHHEHLLEVCRRALGEGGATVHRLG